MATVWKAFGDLGLPLADETRLPGGAPGALAAMMNDIGLGDIEDTELSVAVRHNTFDDWWEPYLHAVGPIGDAVGALSDSQRK
ncbi:hypothetical protein IA539_15305 [Gordonia sp. zg691]|uniref:hypothetical protein n=1 Tax=Gordonia jinghuaiqii TaxID=2758710 RepID=UPI0016625171|nr:hypothetical protein [Gordonia jinghuaiqii]MBD0862570.1 hypothetical protein [Gordonia jinghuaiqii]